MQTDIHWFCIDINKCGYVMIRYILSYINQSRIHYHEEHADLIILLCYPIDIPLANRLVFFFVIAYNQELVSIILQLTIRFIIILTLQFLLVNKVLINTMANLFTYGTLMYQSCMTKFTSGIKYNHQPATLYGFSRRHVKGAHYPGIIKQPESQVNGILYQGISNEHLLRLHNYEGEQYEAIQVEVITKDNKKINALAYLFLNKNNLQEFDWKKQEYQSSL